MKFDVIDMQQPDYDDVHYYNQTWMDVKEIAYLIMKDRSEAVDDELAEKFKEQIKNGFEGLEDRVAIEVLKDWGYKIVEKG